MLGDVLGMDLHLEKAEHKVGGFSLDLIGQDQDTETVVIVENQFGPTDHRHLGQLLTYAGGTSPATIVWIAESFRDEHRAALDWLNARTDSETRFFGVQVGAVTLDGAPADLVAPHFEVVVKPNDWGKEVKKATVDAASDRELLYQEFWTEWLDQVKPRHWTNRKAPAKHWMHIPAGTTKARYSVSFRSNGMLSELYFHHPDAAINLTRWQQLAAKKDLIEQHFGGPSSSTTCRSASAAASAWSARAARASTTPTRGRSTSHGSRTPRHGCAPLSPPWAAYRPSPTSPRPPQPARTRTSRRSRPQRDESGQHFH